MEAKKLQRFSEYSLSTYLLCPRKYRYTYIEKPFKKQKRSVNVYFIFGNAIHLSCKEFYEQKAEDRTLDNLYNIFRNVWKRSGIRAFFNSREEEKELGERGLYMLSNFFNSFGQKVPYKIESYMENKVRDYILFGRIDRIDLSADGTLQIVDYKTTKYYDSGEDNEERDRKTIQLKLYACILDGMKHKVTSGSYYHFEDDKFDTIDFTPESINYLREWFDEIVDDIRYDRSFDKKMGRHCEFCDFFKLCNGKEDNTANLMLPSDELFASNIDNL
ncbi:PD-(D/E)XK nuclease family protein [uncultured Brachyspira sp.]|uniref:RecB family exonuclease n=1 Tax=uncultured Brachyspira sp. TaxID=221953 RepID=UPI0025F3B89F|nr:PD-(D/E)XK nuclease family protein [uncultured Brachyspira sp.]